MANPNIQTTFNSHLLIDYVTAEIRTLEPNLEFARLGVRRDVPKGFATLGFPQSAQIPTSTVATISEGVDPAGITWSATSYTATVTQYGVVVQVTDLLIRNSALEVVDSAVRQVKYALARQLDNAIQSTVNAGTGGVNYAGGKTTRATLGVGDLMDTTLYTRCIRDLVKVNGNGVRPFANNAYAVVLHPSQEYDLMSNTNSGGWLDVGRYSSVDQLLAGKMGDFRGGMLMRSPNVQTFASTTTVYPATFLGQESFGWGYFQQITPILVNTADSQNPLNVYTSIGGKFGVGVTLFENTASSYRIVRAESAVSS